MSVTPNDLLNFARELHQGVSAEVNDRNTISRAYYAAYHAAMAFHEALPSGGDVPPDHVGAHSDFF